jgi:phage tail sheath protein FI
MAYNHGVKTSEVATSLLPPVQSDSGIPFIVGTAPINMTEDVTNVNKPTLCYSYAEAVKAFGYAAPVDDAASGLKKHEFTISEFVKSQFAFFQTAPVVIVNVLDPQKHSTKATASVVIFDAMTGIAKIEEKGILLDSVTLNTSDKVDSGKFLASFDDEGNLVLAAEKNDEGEYFYALGEEITFTANKLDPSAVTEADIIGGINASGVRSGLELIEEVFPRFRVVPSVLLAPYYSASPSVAAVLAAKAMGINKVYQAGVCLIDAPTSGEQEVYSGVPKWKNENNIVNKTQVICYPRLNNDGVLYAMSTQVAGIISKTDGENESVPYVSPSNKKLVATGTVLDNGKEVFLTQEEAGYLNGQGIITALNFIGGWVLWGNRTACYPDNTDPKDSFIPVRRMFAWLNNQLVQNYWSQVDNPMNLRLIDTVIDSANVWLNGLSARQYLLGGRVEFLETENPTTDLMDGISKFHVFFTPPSPNKEIDFIMEYDPSYIQTLFE